MRLFFWDFDDLNDIARQWTMFIINILAVLFTSYCLFKTARYHGKILFEILPLSINTLATIILLLTKLFEKGYQFQLVGYVIQIFTYFLFCYTFALLHTSILKKQDSPLKKYLQFEYRICNGMFLLIVIGSIVFITLIMTSVICRNCENNLVELGIIGFSAELVSYLPTVYFGYKILRHMSKQDQQQKQNSRKSFGEGEETVFEPISDRYIKQRKKQIKLVLAAYTISLLLRGIVLLFNIDWDSYLDCTQIQGIYIITSDRFSGQLLLIMIELNQLIPHLIIPVAFFVVPVGPKVSSQRLNLQSTLIEEDDDDTSDNSDFIQRRISKSIVQRGRDSSSPVNSGMR